MLHGVTPDQTAIPRVERPQCRWGCFDSLTPFASECLTTLDMTTQDKRPLFL
jgi:hypothetical protein